MNGVDVIFIGGRSGVGKTSAAAECSRILAAARVKHAVIEGDGLDQAYPEPWRDGIDLAGRNLASVWANYRELGYQRLIFTNTVSITEVESLSTALGGDVRSTAILLTALDDTAAQRLAQREQGESLATHTARSNASAGFLDTAAPDAIRIATDGLSIADVARQILASAGWLKTE